MNIVLLDAHTANPGDLSWSAVESLATSCTIHVRTEVSEIVSRARDAEVVIINKTPLSRETLSALPKLRYIGVTATGYNVVDIAAARERGIVVTNVPGYSTASVAQAVFALLLELTNHTGHHAGTVARGLWAECPDFCYWHQPIVELHGLTLGLVGLGDIGTAVARIGLALGMKVLAARRTWALPPPDGVQPASIDDVFAQSDVVSLHCPLTEDTKHLVNAQRLAHMKRTAYLINTARGPLVDEPALAAALNEGRLAGAGLDVLSVEPPEKNHVLFQAKNCLITPHIAWASKASRARLIEQTATNIARWMANDAVNVVS